MGKAIRTYFRPRRQEVIQGQMLIELYDGALQYLQQARNQMEAQNYTSRNFLLNKAIEIIEELSRSLNLQSGGDLAVQLNNLYLLCSSRLLRVNQRMCLDDLDSVVAILKRLRAAYALFPGLDLKAKSEPISPCLAENN